METALAIALAIVGIMLLVVLHELGHFFAARATGMRVEKLYLFFGKPIWKVQRGETEYGIGTIPLGGYAKITGMNPEEDLEPEVAPRAYYNQPVWKRIVVILAGPLVNIVIAFVILFGVAFASEQPTTLAIGPIEKGSPAAGKLQRGDEIVSVDGVTARIDEVAPTEEDFADTAGPLTEAVGSHACEGDPRDGCEALTPAEVVIRRDGELQTLRIRPTYDAELERMRLGFQFAVGPYAPLDPSVPEAVQFSGDTMWYVTSETAQTFAQLFKEEERDKLSSIVGIVETTRQAIQFDAVVALQVIALVSLALGLFNLLPILPLDGGHVFWSLVEKIRGRRPSLRTMEQASAVGLMIFLVIFAIGFTNDLDRFSNGGFEFK